MKLEKGVLREVGRGYIEREGGKEVGTGYVERERGEEDGSEGLYGESKAGDLWNKKEDVYAERGKEGCAGRRKEGCVDR